MKVLDVALKDMRQSFRSYFALAFMFGIPILITTIFFFMFGGLRDEDESGFNLPVTSVTIVNLDSGGFEALGGFNPDMSGGFLGSDIDLGNMASFGEMVAQLLENDNFQDILSVSLETDQDRARIAVEDQEVNVAIIIPENFTRAMLLSDETTTIELYQDPTLTIGPAIVGSILNQLVEGFAGTKIGKGVTIEQLSDSGVIVNNQMAGAIAMQFIQAAGGDESAESSGANNLLEVSAPTNRDQGTANTFILIIGRIMAGIMVFFAFFTGAASAQSILTEEEKGTLPRLFTTPTPELTILGGKFLAVALTVLVQIVVLVFFARFVFGIDWGESLQVFLLALATVVLTSTCGIFIISFLKNTRQAGIVFGGVLTLTGMVGIFSVFTVGVSNQQPPLMDTIALLVPQGWAMQALRRSMGGDPLQDVLLIIVGMLVWSAVFFIVAFLRFRKRYA